MANAYGISDADEKLIRTRDTRCVYCLKLMKQPPFDAKERGDWATIEHFDNDGPLDALWNLGICCWACNSSKGVIPLTEWLKTDYCAQHSINVHTVAEPVKIYLKRIGVA